MKTPILTLWGMYQACPEILDSIALPDGMERETMIDYIAMYAGDNESRYGDPHILARLVPRWFSSRKHDWTMMWEALHAEYNPIENYDRHEDFWRTLERNENETENTERGRNSELTGETSGSGTTSATATRTPNITEEESVSAFDSSQYQPKRKTVESGSEGTESSETSTTTANSSQETSENENTERTRISNNTDTEHNAGRAHGNIGVTTNQEMIQSELNLRAFDMYKYIALLFEDEFTIPIYERRCNTYGML